MSAVGDWLHTFREYGTDVVLDIGLHAIGAGVATLAISVALLVVGIKLSWLPTRRFVRVLIGLFYCLALPPVGALFGAVYGSAIAAAHIIERTQLTNTIAQSVVHGVITVVSMEPHAQAMLSGDRLPIAEVPALWAMVPGALGEEGRGALDASIQEKAGGGFAGKAAVIASHGVIAVVDFQGKDVQKRWLTPIMTSLSARQDEQGTVAVTDVVDTAAGVAVGHAVTGQLKGLVKKTITAQAMPLVPLLVVLWLMPFVVTLVVRFARKKISERRAKRES